MNNEKDPGENGKTLRELIASCEMKQEAALELFNSANPVLFKPYALSTWKAWLSEASTARWRPMSDQCLARAVKVFNAQLKKKYLNLQIDSTLTGDSIWLGDDSGSLVSKENGSMNIDLLPGRYVVSFLRGAVTVYPIDLCKPTKLKQADIEKTSPIPRPVFKFKKQ